MGRCPRCGHTLDSQLQCLHPGCYVPPAGSAWFCTCDSPTLLGNGECVRCRRAPEWATLAAVKTYRAERSDSPLGDG